MYCVCRGTLGTHVNTKGLIACGSVDKCIAVEQRCPGYGGATLHPHFIHSMVSLTSLFCGYPFVHRITYNNSFCIGMCGQCSSANTCEVWCWVLQHRRTGKSELASFLGLPTPISARPGTLPFTFKLVLAESTVAHAVRAAALHTSEISLDDTGPPLHLSLLFKPKDAIHLPAQRWTVRQQHHENPKEGEHISERQRRDPNLRDRRHNFDSKGSGSSENTCANEREKGSMTARLSWWRSARMRRVAMASNRRDAVLDQANKGMKMKWR